MQSPLNCDWAGRCSGCSWIATPYLEQSERKLQHLRSVWLEAVNQPAPDIRWVSIDSGGLRDRTDLMIQRQPDGQVVLGLFEVSRRQIFNLERCPQLSPRLNELLSRLQRHLPQIERGSVRLRVAPSGEFGIWLDLANVDIKALLDEETLLKSLMEFATVEMGQKRKRVEDRSGRLKLTDPKLFAWFETYLREQSFPLYCTVGSFTQPGFRANRALVQTLLEQTSCVSDLIEFGAGIGNFTLPLASKGIRVQACELEPLACSGLKRSLEEAALTSQVTVHQGNFQLRPERWSLDFAQAQAVLVDPPRSGLMRFLDPLVESSKKPEWFFYVSCFAESFAQDSSRLLRAGYKIQTLSIVDQFPQSPHYEIVAAFAL